MRWRSESALTIQIERYEEEIASLLMDLPEGASEPSEQLLTALVGLADLENELQFVRNDPPPSGGLDSFVPTPIRPLPHLNSGAIALPEPEEPSS